MAIRGPFKRWRLVEPIHNLEDVAKILRELEDAYEKMVYVLEQGSDDAPGTAPGDAEYILGVADVDLPNGRVLVDGQNTTVDYGTPGEVSIDTPDPPTSLPPSGPAGGDLGGTYPNPIVDGILDEPIESGTPVGNEILQFVTIPSRRWERLLPGGDLVTGSLSAARVQAIQNNPVEVGTPASGDLYRWDGSQLARWSPKYIQATRGSNQTTNIADGDRVRFNVTGADSGHITLDTTTNVGVFTLPPGVYHLTATCNANFSAAGGSVQFRWATSGGTVFGVSPSAVRPYTSSLNIGRPHVTEAIRVVGGASPADVELRILNPTSLDAVELNIAATITALS